MSSPNPNLNKTVQKVFGGMILRRTGQTTENVLRIISSAMNCEGKRIAIEDHYRGSSLTEYQMNIKNNVIPDIRKRIDQMELNGFTITKDLNNQYFLIYKNPNVGVWENLR